MIVTTKGKNALKFMLNLSLYQGNGYVKLKDIAKREEISEKYLEQIVSYLQKARKVKSIRGANGGYRLVKAPNAYTVGEIIRCLEGDIMSADCAYGNADDCRKRYQCLCYPLWCRLDKAINDVLDNTTLQDMIDRMSEIGYNTGCPKSYKEK
jgi:transcriptional regulator, Rrf2 family